MSIESLKNDDTLDQLARMNESGVAAFLAKGFNELPMQDRIAFAQEIALRRYNIEKMKQEHLDPEAGFNQVWRNPGFFARSILGEICKEKGFPSKDMPQFYDLVDKASQGNQEAKNDIKAIFDNIPQEIVDCMLPFYDAFMKDVEKAAENLPEIERQLKLAKAEKDFVGQFIFPFVESRVHEFSDLQGFDVAKRAQLSQKTRGLRQGDNLMEGVLTKIKQTPRSVTPTQMSVESAKQVPEIVEKRKGEYTEYFANHEQRLSDVKKTSDNIRIIAGRIEKAIVEGHPRKEEVGAMLTPLVNAALDLHNVYLRGEQVSDKDIQTAKDFLQQKSDHLLNIAMQEGLLELASDLIKNGANPEAKTKEYNRGFFTRLGDTVKGLFKDGFPNLKEMTKNWKENPERSLSQVATLSGDKEMIAVIKKNEGNTQTTPQKGKKKESSDVSSEIVLTDSHVLSMQYSAKRRSTITEPINLVEPYMKQIMDRLVTVNKALNAPELLPSDDQKRLQIEKEALNSVLVFLQEHQHLSAGSAHANELFDTVAQVRDSAENKLKNETTQHGFEHDRKLPRETDMIFREIQEEFKPRPLMKAKM